MVAFSVAGTLVPGPGNTRLRFPFAVTIDSVAITAGSSPSGAAILVDVNKNGTTIFSTQGNRPSIAVGANASGDQVPDITALTVGDYLTVDLDQVGSALPGGDLLVVVAYH